MSIKYQKFKSDGWSVWIDVHGQYMWWIMIQMVEWWCSPCSEMFGTDSCKTVTLVDHSTQPICCSAHHIVHTYTLGWVELISLAPFNFSLHETR